MKHNYDRTVELHCPVCHGKDFDSTDDMATCRNCRHIASDMLGTWF
jgi:hypothetical protein